MAVSVSTVVMAARQAFGLPTPAADWLAGIGIGLDICGVLVLADSLLVRGFGLRWLGTSKILNRYAVLRRLAEEREVARAGVLLVLIGSALQLVGNLL